MAKKRSLAKPGKLDSYWQLFAEFVFTENKSGTYRETVDRVNFFNAEQRCVKNVPMSANATNACMIRCARRLFSSKPKEKQWSMYDYRRLLVKNLYYHTCWLSDNLNLIYGEGAIFQIMRLFDSILPERFAMMFPDVAQMERYALESVAGRSAGFAPTVRDDETRG